MKNKYLRILFIASILLGCRYLGFAQVVGGLGNSSPDLKVAAGATSAGLSSISSPSIFDGSTNVAIPIHDYSLDGYNYGISLAYNTKGVKVDETVSPAGLHWNILAEGSIVRVIKDLPDELNTTTQQYFDYDDTTVVNPNRFLKGKFVTYTETPAQQAEPNVYRDGECDDFIFSCGGQTFTFNLGKEMYVHTNPHRDIKVTPMIDGTPIFLVEGQQVNDAWGMYSYQKFLEFLITDEAGNKYYFVRSDFRMMKLFTNEFYEPEEMGYCYPPVRWVIKKVTFANGNEIVYNYSTPVISSPFFPLHINYRQYFAREFWNGTNPTSGGYIGVNDNNEQFYYSQLQSIQYPNGTVAEFTYDGTDKTEEGIKMLNEIKISAGDQCLKYRLHRSITNNRWFLNSITLKSCNETVDEPYYSFEYNSLALPNRLSSAQDYYGYYNGNPNGTALQSSGSAINIPVHHNEGGSLSYLNYGNNRLPNSNYAKAGILTKVKNAYGGEVSFAYSANTGFGMLSGSLTLPNITSSFVGQDVADGLKLDSLIEKDKFHPDNSRITTYDYHNSGQLFLSGGYFHYPEYIDSASNNWDKVIFQNMFLTSHQFINNSNHGYSFVTVKTMTGAGEQLSKTDMRFTNMSDETSNFTPRYLAVGKHFFQYPYTDKQYLKDWEIGLPLEVIQYDQNNKIVSETKNFYDFSPVDNSAAPYITNTKKTKVQSGHVVNLKISNIPKPWYPNKKIFTDTYTPYTGYATLRCVKTKSYVSDTRYVEDSTTYTYDAKKNIKTETALNSKREKIKTVYVYNYDAGGPNVPNGAVPGSTLYNMSNGGLEKVVSVEKWKLGSSDKLIDANINTFSYQAGILLTKSNLALKTTTPLDVATYTGGAPNPYGKVIAAFTGQTPSNFEKLTEIKLLDIKGNPLETQLNDMESYKAMIWDTTNGQKIAEAINCKGNEIAYAGFETSANGNFSILNPALIVNVNTISGGGISGDYAFKMNTNLQQSRVAVSNLTPNKQYIVTFWSNGGQPVFAGTGINITSFTALATKGNWTFYKTLFTAQDNGIYGLHSTINNLYIDEIRIHPVEAIMQSWTYKPLFGMSSETNSTGRITYYEYDQLGRKIIVRDQDGIILSKKDYILNGPE